jgi:hypothetical protein
MNKIDLIIDALEHASERETMSSDSRARYELEDSKAIATGLAAARELRELKPVAYIENHKAGQNLSWSQDDLPYAKATPLYALDEVTK